MKGGIGEGILKLKKLVKRVRRERAQKCTEMPADLHSPLPHPVPAQVRQKYSLGFEMDFPVRINYRHISFPGNSVSNKMRPH